jgi:hypothetical protein
VANLADQAAAVTRPLCAVRAPEIDGWTFRAVWPIENPELFDHEAIRLARADLPAVAREAGAVITGQPEFRVADCADQPWPTTATAVVCTVAAAPAALHIARTKTTNTRRAA